MPDATISNRLVQFGRERKNWFTAGASTAVVLLGGFLRFYERG